MSEADNAALPVAQVFQIADSEWSDRLVALLRDADMDSFRTKLVAEHKRRMDALSDRRDYTAAQTAIHGFSVGSRPMVTRSLSTNPTRLLEAVCHTLKWALS
jgi:hypothetical protein